VATLPEKRGRRHESIDEEANMNHVDQLDSTQGDHEILEVGASPMSLATTSVALTKRQGDALEAELIECWGGSFGYGARIYYCPFSTLTLINTTVTDNSALVGGAICNGGVLTIINSTFSGNVARQREGGAIGNYGTLIITNSTFSGNIARSSKVGSRAGGILNGGLFQSAGTLVINNSTLSGNIARECKGGGIFNIKGSTVVRRTVLSQTIRGETAAVP
jgi:hypothetical protein